jgi:hypothetical protein
MEGHVLFILLLGVSATQANIYIYTLTFIYWYYPILTTQTMTNNHLDLFKEFYVDGPK